MRRKGVRTIIRAFAEHRAQQGEFGILANFRPFLLYKIKALGTVQVLMRTMDYV